MWKLKIAEGHGPYLFSTNKYIGRQIWEFDPDAGSAEERAAIEEAREEYKKKFKKDRARALPCSDLLMRMQVVGVYEWAGCNPLPPEFWLFPSFFPYHPAKMWCYYRTTYMPMSYLYGRKYHGPITDLVESLR